MVCACPQKTPWCSKTHLHKRTGRSWQQGEREHGKVFYEGQGGTPSLYVLRAERKDHFINPSGIAREPFPPIRGERDFFEFHYYYLFIQNHSSRSTFKPGFSIGRWFWRSWGHANTWRHFWLYQVIGQEHCGTSYSAYDSTCTTKDYPAENVNSVKARKPWSKRNLWNGPGCVYETKRKFWNAKLVLFFLPERKLAITARHHMKSISDKIDLKQLSYFNHKNFLVINLRCFENYLWMVVFWEKKEDISLDRPIRRVLVTFK